MSRDSTDIPEWLLARMRCKDHQRIRSKMTDCDECAVIIEGTVYLLDLLAAHEKVWTRQHLLRIARLLEAGARK